MHIKIFLFNITVAIAANKQQYSTKGMTLKYSGFILLVKKKKKLFHDLKNKIFQNNLFVWYFFNILWGKILYVIWICIL